MSNKEAATKIVKCLRKAGFEALFAGGCVRDRLLGRRAKDYDVATDAKPAEIMKIFERTLKVGAKFGVVVVLLGDQQVEVATFRTESGYADGRHPENVVFSTAQADASRRDFTINGMFYDPIKEEVIDYVGGEADLLKKIIRTIGDAPERFGEDYLRMLRAVRFSAQLDFEIESETFLAIKRNASKITNISGERIAMELEAVLTHPNRSCGAERFIDSGLAQVVFAAFEDKKVAGFAVKVLELLPRSVDFALALGAFFCGCDSDTAIQQCRRLKLSKNQMKHLEFLLAGRGALLDADMPLADLKMLAAEPYFQDLYELQRAIQKSRKESTTALTKIRRRIEQLGDIELKPKPLLNGFELIRLGAEAGPQVGLLAKELYVAQLSEQIGDPAGAAAWAKNWLAEHKNMSR